MSVPASTGTHPPTHHTSTAPPAGRPRAGPHPAAPLCAAVEGPGPAGAPVLLLLLDDVARLVGWLRFESSGGGAWASRRVRWTACECGCCSLVGTLSRCLFRTEPVPCSEWSLCYALCARLPLTAAAAAAPLASCSTRSGSGARPSRRRGSARPRSASGRPPRSSSRPQSSWRMTSGGGFLASSCFLLLVLSLLWALEFGGQWEGSCCVVMADDERR